MINILGLVFSLLLIMYLAYNGHSTIITAPLIGLLTIIITTGINSKLMVSYTEIYMSGFAGFVKSYFPLFLTGSIFAKLMDEAGYARSIADFITKHLGSNSSILSIVLAGAFLTYGGVSLFVVAFILYPIASLLFKQSEIPKRLIPGTIALGAFTFTMTAMPGSPEIQNLIPMSYFGTDSFAAPLLGLLASFIMLTTGLLYLTYRYRSAKKKGEGYGCNDTFVINENRTNTHPNKSQNVTHINPLISILPVLIVFSTNLFFSKLYYPNTNGSYLRQYDLTLEKISGTWSVILGLIYGSIFIFLVNFKRFKNSRRILDDAIKNSFAPLLNSSAIVGYGSIIKTLPVFTTIKNLILSISSNPIISEAISVNLICGLTASASGGLGITLDALSSMYLEMSTALGISPEILHRIASLSCGGLDTLPHNGAVITTLAICGLSHKESYIDIFVTSVVIPILTTIIIVFLVCLKYYF